MYLSLMDRILLIVVALLAVVALVGVLMHDIQKTDAAAPVRQAVTSQPSTVPAMERHVARSGNEAGAAEFPPSP